MGNIQYSPPFSVSSLVTVSRALNTDYTNTSGKYMYVNITTKNTITDGASAAEIYIYVNGVQHGFAGKPFGAPAGSSYFNVSGIVPPSATYKFTSVTSGTGVVTLLHVLEVI